MVEKRTIDDEIDDVLSVMGQLNPFSDEYEIALNNLKGLCIIKAGLKEEKEPEKKGITPDTLVLAVTNILGILLILNYEQMHVVASKSLNLLFKSRI